ncbi:MAG TPA: hypothetical protein VFD59_16120 [Nocardioidaceae bacterium]|nr:hypothetical protein [Nocardioidaceae bacterium]
MSEALIEPRDPGGILAFAVEQRAAADRAEANLLVAATEFADVYSFADVRAFGIRSRGIERMVRLGGEGTPEVAEFAAAEFGAELKMSTYAAEQMMASALDLRHRLPMTWASVRMQLTQAWIGAKIAKMTRHLSQRAARYVDEQVGAQADQLTPGRLFSLVEAAIIKADPELANERARQQRQTQGVFIGRSNVGGTKSAFIRAQFPIIVLFDAFVQRIAEALAITGDTDPINELRVKAVRVMANPPQVMQLFAEAGAAGTSEKNVDEDPSDDVPCGDPTPFTKPQSSAPPVDVAAIDPKRWLQPATLYVHLNEDCFTGAENGVARCEGHGPITIDQTVEFLGHTNVTVKQVLDLADARPADGYEAPSRLWEQMFLRNPADVFPFGTHLGRRKDLDHNAPYVSPDDGGPPGQTRAGNLGFLSRKHHRIKTFGGYEVWQPLEGVYIWRSPHSALYIVDAKGTRKLRAASAS